MRICIHCAAHLLFNTLLLLYSNVDGLDIATTGVIFHLHSNDGPSEISCFGDLDDHPISNRESRSHRSVMEFVPLNESIAAISSMSRRAGFTGIQPQRQVSVGKRTLGGGRRESKCCLSTFLGSSQPVYLLNVFRESGRFFSTKILNNSDRALGTAIEIRC